MGAQEPLVMDLGDPGAGPETAGGKGSSLARLTRAGFRVPPGFHVTTSAYLDFIGRDGLREQLLSAASEGSAYRASHGIDPEQVSIAVVVQRLVPADAAGVLFTADPLGGPRPSGAAGGSAGPCDTGTSDAVVIGANWGLGESVVAGDVTPDVAVVDRASKTLVRYQTGRKETMTVPGGVATRAEDTPVGLRAKNVLTPDQAAELAQVGLEIEKLYGEPVDVEWALAAGEFDILQARPITTPPAPSGDTPAPTSVLDGQEQWNDSLAGDLVTSPAFGPRGARPRAAARTGR